MQKQKEYSAKAATLSSSSTPGATTICASAHRTEPSQRQRRGGGSASPRAASEHTRIGANITATLPANPFSSPDTQARNSQQVLSTALIYNPAYPSKQNPVAASPAPNGFIHHTVTVDVEYGDDGYVYMYQAYYKHLRFAVAGFGYTEAEALQDLLLAYHEIQVFSLRNGRPIPILRFRFVQHKQKGRKP